MSKKKAINIRHSNIDNAQTELLSEISMAAPDSLIFVFGPGGVGKSTLCDRTTEQITTDLLPSLESDKEPIAAVRIELPAPEPRKVDWSEVFRLLQSGYARDLNGGRRRIQVDSNEVVIGAQKQNVAAAPTAAPPPSQSGRSLSMETYE